MTPREYRLLSFLAAYTNRHGFSPTYRETAYRLQIGAISNVHRMVKSLCEQGLLIKKYPGKSRNFSLTRYGVAAVAPRSYVKHTTAENDAQSALPAARFDGVADFVLIAEINRRGFACVPVSR